MCTEGGGRTGGAMRMLPGWHTRVSLGGMCPSVWLGVRVRGKHECKCVSVCVCVCECVRVCVRGGMRRSTFKCVGGEVTLMCGEGGVTMRGGYPICRARRNLYGFTYGGGDTRRRFTEATQREHAGKPQFLRKFGRRLRSVDCGGVVACSLGGNVRMCSG